MDRRCEDACNVDVVWCDGRREINYSTLSLKNGVVYNVHVKYVAPPNRAPSMRIRLPSDNSTYTWLKTKMQ